MRSARPLAVLLLATALLFGCGESGVKRSVDAQTEALRFYGVDTPRVALIDAGGGTGISASALASLSALPPWGGLWRHTSDRLRSIGIPPARLDQMARGSETIEGLPSSQLAIELTPPKESLTVLVTDASEEMDQLFQRAANRGSLTRHGEIDDASIFGSGGGAFAVRDGVMLAAASIARLREAISTRDGDRGDQLDDRNIQDLLDEVPEQAPLDVYAKPATKRPGQIREAVFAVRGAPYGLRIDAFARLSEQGTEAALPAWRLVTRAPTRQTAARVDGDEMRATLRLQR